MRTRVIFNCSTGKTTVEANSNFPVSTVTTPTPAEAKKEKEDEIRLIVRDELSKRQP